MKHCIIHPSEYYEATCPSCDRERASSSFQRIVRRRTCELYVTEKIEAYNVAIEALQGHEPADGDPTGIARKLRRALAAKLDREIQKWCDANPPNKKAHPQPVAAAVERKGKYE